MRKFIFPGIVVGLVAAFLVVSLHQVRAQEPKKPKVARAVASEVSAVKAYLSGSAKLAGGIADVKFKEDFSKSASNIKVIVSPVGSWSGIYVENVSLNGFTARSGTGDSGAEFNWIAVSGK